MSKEFNPREFAFEHFRKIGVEFTRRRIDGKNLYGIQLFGQSITDGELIHLYPLCDELDVLGIGKTLITDDGLRHLLRLPNLSNIDLTDTAITDAGLYVLASLKKLEYVHVCGTNVTAEGVAMLQHALPQCEIMSDHEG